MEDEGFVDDDFIDDTAREFVGRYGYASLTALRERAAIAEATTSGATAAPCPP